MEIIPGSILKLAFGLDENDTITKYHQEICEEWLSGKGEYIMKVSVEDPSLLMYARYYDKLEEKKSAVWDQIKK